MQPRDKMAAFYMGNILDIAITKTALINNEFQEINPLGAETDTIIIKIAITALFTGLYALSQNRDSRFTWSIERAYDVGIGLVWLAVVLNTVQVGWELR